VGHPYLQSTLDHSATILAGWCGSQERKALGPTTGLVPRPVQSPKSQSAERQGFKIQLQRGEEFYPRLLELPSLVGAKTIVLEVGDDE
jgi:hypothetical protein